MNVTAYRVSDDGGATVRHVAVYGSSAGAPVPSGTRVYADKLFADFVEVAAPEAYAYCGTFDLPWTQPAMAGNYESPGGDRWALWAPVGVADYDNLWHLCDGQFTYAVSSGHRSRPFPYCFYNPNPLRISTFRVYNAGSDYVTGYDFQCSDDGQDWTTLAQGTNANYSAQGIWEFPVNSIAYHRYHQFRVISGTDGDWQNLCGLQMLGVQSLVDPPEVTVLPTPGPKIYIFLEKP
jgi:hypothetical protein